jgi:hypothetical protein
VASDEKAARGLGSDRHPQETTEHAAQSDRRREAWSPTCQRHCGEYRSSGGTTEGSR